MVDDPNWYPSDNPADYHYCLRCYRGFAIVNERHGDDGPLCAYEDCEGTYSDTIGWVDARRDSRGDVPKLPERGVVYELGR